MSREDKTTRPANETTASSRANETDHVTYADIAQVTQPDVVRNGVSNPSRHQEPVIYSELKTENV